MNAFDRITRFAGEPIGQDPVLVAIEAHRMAWEALEAACEEQCRLEELLPADARHEASHRAPLQDFDAPKLRSHTAIDAYYDEIEHQARFDHRMYKAKYLNKALAKLSAERAASHGALSDEAARIANVRATVAPGYDAALERFGLASSAEAAALERVCNTMPMTLAGAAAHAAFIKRWVVENESDLSGLLPGTLNTLASGLAALASAELRGSSPLENHTARVALPVTA